METVAEQQITEVVDCLCNHPRHRELQYKMLDFCRSERTEEELEEFAAAQPETAGALQSPCTLAQALVTHGALAQSFYGEDGTLYDDARCTALIEEGMSEDDVADLLAYRTFVVTAAGAAALDLLSPERRIAAAANRMPERRDAFVSLLEFCRSPRTLDDVKALFADDPVLAPSARTANQPLHAVYFIDRLAEAGGLVWDGSWVTTDAGKRFLASV